MPKIIDSRVGIGYRSAYAEWTRANLKYFDADTKHDAATDECGYQVNCGPAEVIKASVCVKKTPTSTARISGAVGGLTDQGSSALQVRDVRPCECGCDRSSG
jgi:hypothetical protein